MPTADAGVPVTITPLDADGDPAGDPTVVRGELVAFTDLGVAFTDPFEQAARAAGEFFDGFVRAFNTLATEVVMTFECVSREFLALLFGHLPRELRRTETPRRSAMHTAYRAKTRHRNRRRHR